MFPVPRFFLFYRFPITSAKVRILFLSAKYLNLPCMKCHSVCTKWQREGVISLNYSWRITVDLRMHITCCASAYQLICKRTTAVVRPEILTNSKTYTIFSNNLYYVFQQHISNIPTNKKGWIIYLWHTLFAKSDAQLILPYNIIHKLIIAILQPSGNIFSIFHKALFLLFLVQITIAKIPPVIFITKIHIPTSLESSDKNKRIKRLGFLVFCSLLRIRPIVVRL